MSFEPGRAIVLREVWRRRIFEARPAIVVEDGPDQTILVVPGGARCAVPVDEDGHELRLPDRDWRLEVRRRGPEPVLSFAWPETPYAVLLWATDGRRAWYVNLQDPLRRTPIGFDTADHALDVVIELDGAGWSWKDEEELRAAIEHGLFTEDQAAGFRRSGEEAARRVIERRPPFDRDWTSWRPDPAWSVAELPPGWDEVPAR